MKKLIIITVCLAVLGPKISLNAQTAETWPDKSSSFTFYVSSLLGGVNPIILSYEKINHKGWLHFGYTAGLTTIFYEGVAYSSFGPHFALTAFTGKKKHHFESKLGVAYTPVILYSTNKWNDLHFKFNPVVTLGYRNQKPDGKKFWRVGISTAGFGFGMGWNF